jgi:hypothetical protein
LNGVAAKLGTTWELLSAKGDGTPSRIVVVPNVPEGQSLGHKVSLHVDPVLGIVRGWVDGVLIAEITDPAVMPDTNTMVGIMGGLFVTSGVHVAGGAGVQGMWSAMHCNHVGAYVGP